jgi:hypothetical protein
VWFIIDLHPGKEENIMNKEVVLLTLEEVEVGYPNALNALKLYHLESLNELPDEDFQENMGCSRNEFDFDDFSSQGQFFLCPLRGNLLSHQSFSVQEKYHEYLSTPVCWDGVSWEV